MEERAIAGAHPVEDNYLDPLPCSFCVFGEKDKKFIVIKKIIINKTYSTCEVNNKTIAYKIQIGKYQNPNWKFLKGIGQLRLRSFRSI